ncbi:ABC transporter ATP-binding protein, partial [Clostridium perfringens]|nr:ABC transporter ATP-binding protein [Clostridium perfringens]
MIKLKGINKYYSSGEEKLHALKDVDLEVKKGEFLAIM